MFYVVTSRDDPRRLGLAREIKNYSSLIPHFSVERSKFGQKPARNGQDGQEPVMTDRDRLGPTLTELKNRDFIHFFFINTNLKKSSIF